MALGTALLVAGTAAKVGSSIVKGVGQYRAAQGIFTEADAAELARLQRLKEQGDLGLTEREKAGMAAESAGQVAQTQAELRNQALQQQAAQATLGGPITGRDVFLREQAAQAGRQQAQAEIGRRQASADEARRQEQLAKLAELRRLRTQESIAKKTALFGILGETVATGADLALARGAQLEEVEKKAPKQGDLGGGGPNPYQNRL